MSDEPDAPLPWDALRQHEGDIPWPALERFADALVADPDLWPELREVYEAYFDMGLPTYEFIYVPAIVALAGARLGPEMRCEIACFLVEEIISGEEDRDDLLCEIIEMACGSLGPPALPAILEALDEMESGTPAGSVCGRSPSWPPTRPTRRCERESPRAAFDCLESLEADDLDVLDAGLAADTLAKLKWADARPLIDRLWRRTRNADLREALRFLDGKADPELWKEIWERPVRECVQERWKWARESYQEQPEEDESGSAEEPEEDYVEGEPSYELEGGAGWEEEEEDEEFQPGPPLQSKPTVGRNDPCPCGSGKKFKKCCGR